MSDDDDDDLENQMTFDDDEPLVEPQSTAAAALPAPAAPPVVAAPSTYIVPAASSSAQPAHELEGNAETPIFMLYKKVMESVFADVRHIVEKEGLEPGVAVELRNKWTERMNRSKVLSHLYSLANEPASSATAAGGGQQFYPQQYHPPSGARVASAPVSTRPAAASTSGRGKLRGDTMYDAPVTAAPSSYMEKPVAGGKRRKGNPKG